jgi:hypothetical protein
MRGTSGAENSVTNAINSAARERRLAEAKRQAGAAKAAGRGSRRV